MIKYVFIVKHKSFGQLTIVQFSDNKPLLPANKVLEWYAAIYDFDPNNLSGDYISMIEYHGDYKL